MNYEGLHDFLGALCDGEALSDFELEDIEQIGCNDDGETLFAVVISYKSLVYRASSYLPPAGVRGHIMQMAQEIYRANPTVK